MTKALEDEQPNSEQYMSLQNVLITALSHKRYMCMCVLFWGLKSSKFTI